MALLGGFVLFLPSIHLTPGLRLEGWDGSNVGTQVARQVAFFKEKLA